MLFLINVLQCSEFSSKLSQCKIAPGQVKLLMAVAGNGFPGIGFFGQIR